MLNRAEERPASSAAGDAQARLDAIRPVPRITIQAFCETAEVATAVEGAFADRRLVKAHCRVQRGGVAAAREHYASAPTPNLMILESTGTPAAVLADLEALADVCDPTSKVLVIGHQNDVLLYRELLRRGISDYLVAPIDLLDVLTVISDLFAAPDAEPLGRSIAFVSAKGGAGSSTIAHNVAWSISRNFESDVLLADLDLPFGTANINFDQDPPQGISEALFSAERVDDVLLDRLLVKCADHLSLLAAPSILDRTYDFPLDAFTPLVEAAQRGAPNVVLDVPHVWNEWTKNVLLRADEIVVTAVPDLANLRNAKNLIDTLRKARPNDVPPRLVLNQVGLPKRPEITPEEFAEPLQVQLLATIGFDPAIFGTAANNGRMIAETDAKHPIAAIFAEIAATLTGRSETKTMRRPSRTGLLSRLRGR